MLVGFTSLLKEKSVAIATAAVYISAMGGLGYLALNSRHDDAPPQIASANTETQPDNAPSSQSPKTSQTDNPPRTTNDASVGSAPLATQGTSTPAPVPQAVLQASQQSPPASQPPTPRPGPAPQPQPAPVPQPQPQPEPESEPDPDNGTGNQGPGENSGPGGQGAPLPNPLGNLPLL